MGPAHPESAYPLSGLAHLYARQGKYAEAEPLYQRALRIWEAQVGETHLLTGETRRALAELQEAQGHHEEARSGFERAWAVRTQVLGAAAPPTPEARQHLLALLRAIGQYEEVARLKAAQPEQGTSEAAPARLPEDEQREPPQASPESGQHLSENTRRRIAILSQVPPISTLRFVGKSRENARVGGQILSENLFERELEKEMPDACNDLAVFQEFREALGTRDPKTIATYLTTMRDFVAWLAMQPGGTPFHLGLITETAIRGYMDSLQQAGRAPRTRSKALSGLRRFCRWAMDEGYLRRNPAWLMERPTVVAMAPTELSEKQRFVLNQLVERHATPRFTAIFALGYWAGLRISEIAALRLDQCHINQRAGSITVLDAKGGKTRTLDLHNLARRALYEYLFPARPHDRERDEESVYVFTSQRAAWLRQQGRPDHLSERGMEHLWMQVKQKGTHDEWERIASVTFHDLRHDFAHRARAAGWSLEEIAVYLGHQTKDGAPALATTVRYTLPSRQQLKERIQELPG